MQYVLRFSPIVTSIGALALLLLPHASFAATAIVSINDDFFGTKSLTITAGDTITWTNHGSMSHTATADNGSFDSGTIQPGESFSATFNQPGTYSYYCKFHGGPNGVGMSGTIIVVAATAPSSSTQSTYVSPYPPAYGTPTYTPTYTAPTNADALATQAQALLNQIAILKQQLAGGTSSAGTTATYDSSSCPLIGRSLKVGSSGDDVTRLQQFLARDTAIYPEGTVSGFYGALTQAAVQRWQVKYHIVSSGSPDTTGYGVVGPRTAAAIAILCTTGSYAGVAGPSSAASPVGGFITVTPVSGAAPLVVNVTATVNTTNSCAGSTYALDFGDGSPVQQIPVAAGNCGQFNQTYPHTYQYGGTYQVKLSAGTHQTSATVIVSGTAAPTTQFISGLPAESFTANPTSGAVPLTVTFSGVVNSNDKGFCAGGCGSVLDFGDGTSGQVALPAALGGWLNYSVTHTYKQTGGFQVTLYQGGAGAAQPKVGTVTIVVNAAGTDSSSSSGTTSSNYTYNPPVVAASGTGSLSFTTQFDLPSSCTGYDLAWGDGSAHVTQSNGTSCAQNTVVDSLTHTYAGVGSYTIVLKRGPTLAQVDDVSITISN